MPVPSIQPPDSRDLRHASDSEREVLARSLYESVGPRVMALGYRYFGGDDERAEELVAETFARVIVGLPTFEGRSAFATWILRIAMNVIAEWMRHRYRREAGNCEADDSLPSLDPTASSQMQREDIERIVRECLLELSPEHRMVISLVALDGVSHATAAELLGVAEGTIWSRYARARLALASRLQARGFGPRELAL